MIDSSLACFVATLLIAGGTAAAAPGSEPNRPPATQPGAESRLEGARRLVYKRPDPADDTQNLSLHAFLPDDWAPDDRRGAVIYFHGGGWANGDAEQFADFCRSAAAAGMVAVTAEYRLSRLPDRPATTCMEDARDAFTWLSEHAEELGIDPARIAAGGGSAGGQLAISLVFDPPMGLAEEVVRPAALVLMNPVLRLDNSRFSRRFGGKDAARAASPIHSLAKDPPPMILFLGTEDDLIPVALAESFRDRVAELGGRCDLRLFEGEEHAFFNRHRSEERFGEVDAAAVTFLREHGLAQPSQGQDR